jgi:F420-0:gamma-glutamyl ligase-like protein
MVNYRALAVTTKYWMPRENYVEEIIRKVEGKIADGDFVVISEKAISTALGNIVDESQVKPNLNARFIAAFWMRIVWGYILGPLCHFRGKLLEQLRRYPYEAGSRHKQIALQYAGFSQALIFGSEGGIDGSNLAYSYVSLPLDEAERISQEINRQILLRLQKKVYFIVADTDKTYSLRNFHFTPRPKPIKGIHSSEGFVAYVVGRTLRLKKRATPIAAAGGRIPVETALDVSEIANRARGFGAGKTVWEMAEKFKTGLTEVSWEMLATAKHKPIVIIRSKR